MLPENHELAANSAAKRKLPTHPKYFNNGMVTISAPIGRLQFAAAGLAEIAQWVHLVDQVGQVDECPVRGQIGIEYQPARLFGRFNHGIAGENLHSGDESVEVDKFRNLGLVVDNCIGVQPRCFPDEALVELLTLGRGPQRMADAVLATLSHP